MIRKEALVALTILSQPMVAKIDESMSHIRGWVNGWVTIAVLRLFSPMIHRDHSPSTLQDREPDWDP